MRPPKRIVILGYCSIAFLLAISGCSVTQQLVAGLRETGEHMTTTPDAVWLELQCGKRERPFFRLEALEILPQTIEPGGRINYRLTYVMCPDKPSEIARARVSRNLFFRGEHISRIVKDDFQIKPGRWVVDSFFAMPRQAPLGVHLLSVDVEIPNRPLQTQARSFVVKEEFHLP